MGENLKEILIDERGKRIETSFIPIKNNSGKIFYFSNNIGLFCEECGEEGSEEYDFGLTALLNELENNYD